AYNTNNTLSPYPNAYKETTVYAHWVDTVGAHAITVRSAIYPGGLGPLGTGSSTTTTSTTAVGAPSPPTNATAVDEQPPTDTSSIYVSWTAPASSTPAVDHYVVQYNTTGAFSGAGTYASSPSVTATNWIAGSLTPGTVYYFQVISVAASGTVSTTGSNVASAPTAGSGGTPPSCTVSGLSVTPTQGVVNAQNQLVNATSFGLAVNASSGCSDVTVAYTTSGGQPHQATVSGSGGQMTGTAGTSSTTWDPGTDPFSVYVNGVAYSPTVQQLVNICVENGGSGKC
ncbi:MAG: fibronectin type III domain-containing protein, partial [Acidimicrobiales bacterium]